MESRDRIPFPLHRQKAAQSRIIKRMLDPGMLAGNALVAPCLALAQGLARPGPTLQSTKPSTVVAGLLPVSLTPT